LEPVGAGAAGTALTRAVQDAIDLAQGYARSADALATLCAYKPDWAHYAAWCDEKNLVPVPAAPVTVGAYLASLGETHAPTTILATYQLIGFNEQSCFPPGCVPDTATNEMVKLVITHPLYHGLPSAERSCDRQGRSVQPHRQGTSVGACYVQAHPRTAQASAPARRSNPISGAPWSVS
jgi:hypothetical protein